MPALTHGRVINGFNLLPREILFSNIDDVSPCDKKIHCGKPLQYTNMQVSGLCKRVSKITSIKKSTNTVVVGRTFAAKRAISRRVANETVIKSNNGDSKHTFKYCSMKPGRNFGMDDNINLRCNNKGNPCSY